jgi:hypothetical protein
MWTLRSYGYTLHNCLPSSHILNIGREGRVLRQMHTIAAYSSSWDLLIKKYINAKREDGGNRVKSTKIERGGRNLMTVRVK